MAFDRNDPGQLQELKDELLLAAYAGITATAQVLKLLNDPAENDGTGGRTPGNETITLEFDVRAMLDALDPTDYDAQQTVTGAATYTHTLVELGAYDDIASYKTKWRSMFAANSATVTALDAQVRALSRSEALWGAGTTIVRDDIAAARA